MNPAVITRALEYAEAAITLDRSAEQLAVLETDLAAVQKAISRLTDAIVTGGELGPLVEALATYERQRTGLEARLAAARTPK
jgi:hypothetical protein